MRSNAGLMVKVRIKLTWYPDPASSIASPIPRAHGAGLRVFFLGNDVSGNPRGAGGVFARHADVLALWLFPRRSADRSKAHWRAASPGPRSGAHGLLRVADDRDRHRSFGLQRAMGTQRDGVLVRQPPTVLAGERGGALARRRTAALAFHWRNAGGDGGRGSVD